MGNFFDDLNKFLADLTPKKSDAGMWNALQGQSATLNLDGVSASSPLGSRGYSSPRSMPYEQIASLIENRQKAFNVIQISPFNLSQDQYGSQIPQNIINATVGYEGDQDAAVGGNGPFNTNAWRTVEIPIPGDFLKIDFLPSQVNFAHSILTTPNPNNYGKEDQTDTLDLNPSLNSNYVDLLQNRSILIQFDDTTQPPYLHKPGESYKLPFQKVFITCKTYVPRIEVTIGYSATISSDQQSRIMSSQMDTGPGYGIWDSSSRHCVPFCFTEMDQDLGTKPPTVVSAGTVIRNILISGSTGSTTDPWAGTEYKWTLIDLENQLPEPWGVGIGWITDMDLTILFQTNSIGVNWSVNVYIEGDALQVGANPPNNAFRRKLLTSFRGNTIVNANAATVSQKEYYNKNFSKPIRFSLNLPDPSSRTPFNYMPRLVVCAKAWTSGASNMNMSWTMHGYTFGRLNQENRIQESYNPSSTEAYYGYGMDLLTTHPFPLDQAYSGQTNRKDVI